MVAIWVPPDPAQPDLPHPTGAVSPALVGDRLSILFRNALASHVGVQPLRNHQQPGQRGGSSHLLALTFAHFPPDGLRQCHHAGRGEPPWPASDERG